MKEMMQKLREAALQAILETEDVDSLENLRVKYLGKKGELTGILRQMGKLTAEERPQMGQLANQLRSELEETLETRRTALNEARLEMKLLQETVDVTLPGKKQPQGHKHPMYNVLDQIKDIFIGMGFEIVDGPEVELSDYNFTKLNIDEGHPSREWTDTFYFTDDSRICLRTQTSPMQIHAMETKPLPIRMIAPGRVYRKDEVDATHSPMFHQIEGMVIDKAAYDNPNIRWKSDEDFEGDSIAIDAYDKAMHNRGYMKGPDSHWTSDKAEKFRDYSLIARRIITTDYFKANKNYYLRMRLVLENPNAEMNFDYMEWCPKSIFSNNEDKH